MAQPRIKITPQGRKRLRDIYAKVYKVGFLSLKKGMEQEVKKAVVDFAPTLREERNILSKGSDGVGTWLGGRFFKTAPQKYLKTVIKHEPVKMEKTKTIVSAKFGNPIRINPKIGFSWQVIVNGKQQIRSTIVGGYKPVWNNLLNLWENGGSYRVFSRKREKYDLSPAPGIKVPVMQKTIPKFGMFKKGYLAKKQLLRSKIIKDIKMVVKTI